MPTETPSPTPPAEKPLKPASKPSRSSDRKGDLDPEAATAAPTKPRAKSAPQKHQEAAKAKKTKKSAAKGKKGRVKHKKPTLTRRRILLVAVELVSLTMAVTVAAVVGLGYAADRFSGSQFFSHLLPFTLGLLGLIVVIALFLIGWLRLRYWLGQKGSLLPAAIPLLLVLATGVMAMHGDFFFAFNQFRILVGGKSAAEHASLTHQIFAAYRRQDMAQLRQLIDRAAPFAPGIEAAAQAFALDPDLLQGVAAAESSFLPRESKDGGQGLFQITQIPASASDEAAKSLGVNKPDPANPRHNSFLAAATLRYYLAQMRGDLFLGLLAYNIGPKNGGLLFIMRQYGATDFVSIQPYLQQLPRHYPVRVLSQALAFRLHRRLGTLPAYEDGLNAVRIQHIGIPGL